MKRVTNKMKMENKTASVLKTIIYIAILFYSNDGNDNDIVSGYHVIGTVLNILHIIWQPYEVDVIIPIPQIRNLSPTEVNCSVL